MKSDVGRYVGRFVLPLVLLLAAVAAWFMADRLGASDPAAVSADTPTVTTTLTSVRRVPAFVATSTEADLLANALNQLPVDPGGLSCAVVYRDGEPVLDLRADRTLVPAYAQMFITGHAAIEVLGADHRFETQVFADALPDVNGRIFNGAYLIGGGDPGLMTRNYALSFRPARTTRTAIEELAVGVTSADVVRIDGGVIAVERRFDAERTLPGWPDSYLTEGVIGPLSALQLDDGYIERAAANLGVAVPSDDPATLAAERFAGLLRDLDVQVFGDVRALAADEPLPELVPVARVFSPPLSEIVFQTLAVNDATAAELLMKELGVANERSGTTQAGGRAVQEVLVDQGVDVPIAFRDGSGLDPLGATSCLQLAQAADTIPIDHPTLAVLPAHDLPGIADARLTGLELEADVRLVGGTFGDARGLVGRTVDEGSRITFATIVNRPGGPSDGDMAYQDALVGLVDALRTSVSVEGIAVDD